MAPNEALLEQLYCEEVLSISVSHPYPLTYLKGEEIGTQHVLTDSGIGCS